MSDLRRPTRTSITRAPAIARGIWPLMLPALVVTAALIVIPIIWSVILSLSASAEPGLTVESYLRMIQDRLFWNSLRVTFLLFIVSLGLQLFLGMGLGYLLSLEVRGRRLIQAMILIPSITASVAIGLLWSLIYDPNIGIANAVFEAFGLNGIEWLGNPQTAIWALIITEIWQWTPFVSLIISAGIRSLPQDIFEAAAIDGASGWKKAAHVGLPLLAPVLSVVILLRTVDLLRFFDLAYVMTQGGPLDSTKTLNLYAYLQAFTYQNSHYAATLQVTLFLIVVVVAAIFTFVRRRFSIEY